MLIGGVNNYFNRLQWSAGEPRICAAKVISLNQTRPPEISILTFSESSLTSNLSLEMTTRKNTHHLNFYSAKCIYMLLFVLLYFSLLCDLWVSCMFEITDSCYYSGWYRNDVVGCFSHSSLSINTSATLLKQNVHIKSMHSQKVQYSKYCKYIFL